MDSNKAELISRIISDISSLQNDWDDEYVKKIYGLCHDLNSATADVNVGGLAREIMSYASQYKNYKSQANRIDSLGKIRRAVGRLSCAPKPLG